MIKNLKQSLSWRVYLPAILLALLLASVALAAWDGSPYDAGETLDPECAPTTANCTVASSTLQNAYSATSGNTLVTTDNRDLTFTLADTTTDSNLIFNLAGQGDFIIKDNGTAFVTFADDGSTTLSATSTIVGTLTLRTATSSRTFIAADSESARGAMLRTAVSEMTASSTLVISPGVFDIGANVLSIPAYSSFIGSGQYSTVIKSQGLLETQGPIVQPTTNNTISDLSVIGTLTSSTYQAAIGWNFDGGLSRRNILIRDVYMEAGTDALYFMDYPGRNNQVTCINCKARTLWDALATFENDPAALGSLDLLMIDPDFATTGNHPLNRSLSRAFTIGHYGTTTIIGGKLYAENAVAGNASAEALNIVGSDEFTTTVKVFGTSIEIGVASSTNAKSISAAGPFDLQLEAVSASTTRLNIDTGGGGTVTGYV